VHKYIHNVTKVMCALYVGCALPVLQKECRKVWGACYMLGARYWSENTVNTIECTVVKTNKINIPADSREDDSQKAGKEICYHYDT